jgi:hypothetical protein
MRRPLGRGTRRLQVGVLLVLGFTLSACTNRPTAPSDPATGVEAVGATGQGSTSPTGSLVTSLPGDSGTQDPQSTTTLPVPFIPGSASGGSGSAASGGSGGGGGGASSTSTSGTSSSSTSTSTSTSSQSSTSTSAPPTGTPTVPPPPPPPQEVIRTCVVTLSGLGPASGACTPGTFTSSTGASFTSIVVDVTQDSAIPPSAVLVQVTDAYGTVLGTAAGLGDLEVVVPPEQVPTGSSVPLGAVVSLAGPFSDYVATLTFTVS